MGITSGVDIESWVKEDGVEECWATLTCYLLWDNGCNGVDTFECPVGSTMAFKYNDVQYYCKKYGRKYPKYLERTVDAKLVITLKNLLVQKFRRTL